MAHDHNYIRNLLRLRDRPHVPIAWLLLPWLAGAWWSVHVVRVLLPVQAPMQSGWVTFFTIGLGREFLLAGGLGTIATWAWLYYAWPNHPRVLCWAATLGLLGLVALPVRAGAVAPLVVSLCMVGAILEQSICGRMMQRELRRAASAV